MKLSFVTSKEMWEEKIAETTKYALDKAKDFGAVISFDPNLRPPLWDDLEKAKEQMLSLIHI